MAKEKNITILAVETSCDDTGIAVIEAPGKTKSDFNILSNIISSQTKVHEQYGGVFPSLAKREHQKNLVPVLIQALKEAQMLKENPKIEEDKLKTLGKILEREKELSQNLIGFLQKYEKPDIDYIAVTNGPGLEPCLWVGTNFAKALAYYWELPIIPVNHIEAHILVNFIEKEIEPGLLPAVCLIVSGGHTQLVLMKKLGKYEIIGETRDDAAGECFDKTARVLGLGYPGGPAIAEKAKEWELSGKKPTIKLPRPMANTNDYDFSFSGLKTAVLYEVKNRYGDAPLRSAFSRTTEGRQYIEQMCAEIQQAAIDILLKKTMNATINYGAKSIILGGGVTANQELRRQLQERIQKLIPNVKLLAPEAKYSTDNGLMIAIAAYSKLKSATSWKKIEVDANLRI